jgi:acetolactate synthase-1/2/3 large subunit
MQSNGLASMGYGLPAAIGAQFVHPDRTVVAMVGDGCMLMTLGELAVAADNGLPLVVVVVNDASLSLIKVRADKLRQGLSRHATDGERARFDVVGQAFGAHGVRVETLAAFEAAFDEAVRSRRFTVIDAQVDPAEYAEQM